MTLDFDRRAQANLDKRLAINEAMHRREQVNINDWIDAISGPQVSSRFVQHESQPGAYAYIRDKHGAETLEQALRLLESGKVDEKIVQIWVEYNIFGGDQRALLCLHAGYPQLREELLANEKKQKS